MKTDHTHTSDEKLHILEKFRTPATGRAFYKIPEREKARGEGKGKVINKSIENHNGTQTEAGVEEYLQTLKAK